MCMGLLLWWSWPFWYRVCGTCCIRSCWPALQSCAFCRQTYLKFRMKLSLDDHVHRHISIPAVRNTYRCCTQLIWFGYWGLDKMAAILPPTFWMSLFWSNFTQARGPIVNKSPLFQIMAWCQYLRLIRQKEVIIKGINVSKYIYIGTQWSDYNLGNFL